MKWKEMKLDLLQIDVNVDMDMPKEKFFSAFTH
jgi:hypothetical protein